MGGEKTLKVLEYLMINSGRGCQVCEIADYAYDPYKNGRLQHTHTLLRKLVHNGYANQLRRGIYQYSGKELV